MESSQRGGSGTAGARRFAPGPDGPGLGRRRFLTLAGASVVTALVDARAGFAERIRAELIPWKQAGSFEGLADAYSLASDVVYLNHASIGTIPRTVQEARSRYQELCEENPWLYIWGGAWEEGREEVRRKAADLLGCEADELALTHNTTEGFNVLAQGLPLGPGDEVLFSSMNHPGASICWQQQAARRGFSVRRLEFPVERAAGLEPDDLVERYLDGVNPRTRALVFPHVDNIVGFRYPVRELAAGARERGVEFVAVDGAQAVGMLPFRVADLGVDFYSTSPHKWVQSPKEMGLLWVRRERLGDLEPMWTTWGQERWAGTARVFEDYGTRDLPQLLALGHALDFQAELGPAAKAEHYRALRAQLRARVDEHTRLRWRSPRRWEFGASLNAVEVIDVPASQVFSRLFESHGFVFRAFSQPALNTVRISPNALNTEGELDRFVSAAGDL